MIKKCIHLVVLIFTMSISSGCKSDTQKQVFEHDPRFLITNAQHPYIDFHKREKNIQNSKAKYHVYIPKKMARYLMAHYNDLVISDETSITHIDDKKFLEEYSFTAFQSPFAVIADYNNDNIRDIALMNEKGILFVLSNGETYRSLNFPQKLNIIEYERKTSPEPEENPFGDGVSVFDGETFTHYNNGLPKSIRSVAPSTFDSVRAIKYESSSFYLQVVKNGDTYSIINVWDRD